MDITASPTTSSAEVVQFFRVLADQTRLVILRLLALSDLRASESSATLQMPSIAVSYHLKQLRSLGLLRDRLRNICPAFPGDPNQVHWSIADPAVIEDPERRLTAFHQVAYELQTRIRYLLLLPHLLTGQCLQVHGTLPLRREGGL